MRHVCFSTRVSMRCRLPPQHVMKHMNLQPLEPHNVDFSRVRLWNLNNWAKHYRQTMVFSAIQDPQINNLLSKHCSNYRGQVSQYAKHKCQKCKCKKKCIKHKNKTFSH